MSGRIVVTNRWSEWGRMLCCLASVFPLVASSLTVTVVDPEGAAGSVSAPASAQVELPAALVRAAADNRLAAVESRPDGVSEAAVPAQFVPVADGASTGTVWWMLAPGPNGDRQYTFAEVDGDHSDLVSAEWDADLKCVAMIAGDLPILRYHHGLSPLPDGAPETMARGDYIHPLNGPNGEALTGDFPKDHLHHRGVQWSWATVRWKGEDRDPYALRGAWHRPTGVPRVQSGPVVAIAEADSNWLWDDVTPVVSEHVVIRAFRATAGRRFVDVDISLTALVDDLLISGRQGQGYSGFCIRFSEAGEPGKTQLWTDGPEAGTRRAWASYVNRPSDAQATSGVVILQHDANPLYPSTWIEYPPIFWVQPAFPGTELFPLTKGEPVKLRFRLWIHPGDVTDEACARLWQSYNRPPRYPPRLVYESVKAYRPGQSRRRLTAIEASLRGATPRKLRAVEHGLMELLSSPEVTPDAKEWACRLLYRIGTNKAVPTLARLLADEALGDAALNALSGITGPAARAALRLGAAEVTGLRRLGLVNAVGNRCGAEAVPMLAVMAAQSDAPLARASIRALGKIGGLEATRALQRIDAHGPIAEERDHALLACAAGLVTEGHQGDGARLFGTLLAPEKSRPVRRAALLGLARCDGPGAGTHVLEFLSSPDAKLQRTAVQLVGTVSGAGTIAVVADALPQLAFPVQATVLHALGRRGNRAVGPQVARAVTSTDTGVRQAAVKALGFLGDSRHIELLTGVATDPKPVGPSAVESLCQLQGEGIDDAILRNAREGPGGLRVLLIRTLTRRRSYASLIAFYDFAENGGTPETRRAAFAAIGELAGADAAPRVLDLLLSAPLDSRGAAVKACTKVCARAEVENERDRPVLIVCADATPDELPRLFAVLCGLGGSGGLDVVSRHSRSKEKHVRDAAVRALANWQHVSAAEALLEVMRESDLLVHQVLAARAVVRLAGAADMPPSDKADIYGRALSHAERPDEKKLVLAGLARENTLESLRIAAPHLDDPALRAEAAATVVSIALPGEASGGLTAGEIDPILRKASALLTREDERQRVETYLGDLPMLRGRSVAAGKPATGSVPHQGGWIPAKAVDGKISRQSYWSGAETPAWMRVDLQEVLPISHVKVVFYWDGTRYYQYTVDASLDGEDWQVVVDERENTAVSTVGGFTHRFGPVQARYIRVHILKNSANPGAHISELMVYRTR